MNEHEFIEATASGLRKMGKIPDYLLIIVDRFENWEYDETTLCGIPVIKSHISINYGYSGNDYPIIPCFINLDEKEIGRQVYYFQRGFEQKCSNF